MPTIRFIRPNRLGRHVGTFDSEIAGGVQATLVESGFAEYVAESSAPPPKSNEEPGPENQRGRKRRTTKETFE